MSEDDLMHLVEAVAGGDRRAARALFDAVAPIFVAAARRTMGSGHPDFEDFVQEASIRFFRSLPAFRGDSRVRRYAYKIGTHVAADWIRSKQALKRAKIQGEVPEDVVGPHDPARDLARQRVNSLLERTLSPEQLETFLLRNSLGCSLAEVADATGVSENTARSRLRLAKESLRRALAARPHAISHWEEPS